MRVSFETRVGLMFVCLLASAEPAFGQGTGVRGGDVYLETVARYFAVGSDEMRILGEWGITDEEIPVVLFLAARSGMSADAIAVQRSRGTAWPQMLRRYGVTLGALHVPFASDAALGALGPLYGRIANTARPSWNRIELTDREVVMLVNVRVLASQLDVAPERVLAASADSESFVHTLQRLVSG